jgi:hypothetical protein
MPSQPIATWSTPCSSRKVQALDTSTRRHTIGLIPSGHTLICTMPAASETGGAASRTELGCFDIRGTKPV